MTAQKTRGEVFTPLDLINEMLDKLPNEVWYDANLKWLEPSAGNGRFVKAVYDRLMLTIKDEKHILENMLYMVELDADNCETIRNTYDAQYKLNIFEGDYKEYTTNIQFDIIYGNPPYQKVYLKTGKSIGGTSLWSVFINNSIKILKDDGFLLFVTPCSWMSGGSNKQSGNILNGVMKKYTIYHLNIQECSKHFKKVWSTFSYYLIKKSFEDKDFDCVCAYKKQLYTSRISNNDFRKLQAVPILLNNTMINIINKMVTITAGKTYIIIRGMDNRCIQQYLLNKNKDETDEEYKERAIKNGYLYEIQNSGTCVLYSSKMDVMQDKNKVLLSNSGHLYPSYDAGNKGVGHNCLCILVNDEIEGNKIINLINSKLYKLYLKTNKWCGFNNIPALKRMPDITDYIDIITDKKIYDYFNLTDEEINLIEDNISM